MLHVCAAANYQPRRYYGRPVMMNLPETAGRRGGVGEWVGEAGLSGAMMAASNRQGGRGGNEKRRHQRGATRQPKLAKMSLAAGWQIGAGLAGWLVFLAEL